MGRKCFKTATKTHTCRDDPAAMRTSDASTIRYVSSTRGRGILSPKNTTVGCLFAKSTAEGNIRDILCLGYGNTGMGYTIKAGFDEHNKIRPNRIGNKEKRV